MNVTVAEIAELVGGRVHGDASLLLTGVRAIRQARPGDLTFLSDPRYRPYLTGTRAAAALVGRDLPEAPCTRIEVDQPFTAFLRVLEAYPPSQPVHPVGIDPTAAVAEEAELGEHVAIGPHAFVGPGARLGDNVVVYPNVFVGARCSIGSDTVIYANASLREDTRVGQRCIIHCGASIGSDGFGFVPRDGRHEKVPQVGNVELGDDVEVGANSTIDRAAFGTTLIGSGTKVDNLVQIGHNTEVGEHCLICGNAGVAGSAIIGDHVTVAAGAGVAGHLEVGDHVTIAGYAGVTKSIPPGRIVSGFPATDHAAERRVKVATRRLPDALRTLRELERRVEELENLLHGRETENDR